MSREPAGVAEHLGPILAGAVLSIDAARRLLPGDPEAAEAVLARAADRVEAVIAEVRRLGVPPPGDAIGSRPSL